MNNLYKIVNAGWLFRNHWQEDFVILSYKPTGKYRIDEKGSMEIEFVAQCEELRFFFNNVHFERTAWVAESNILFSPQWKEFYCHAN